MIDRIIDFSAKNRFIVFLLVAALGLLGWWSLQHLTPRPIHDLREVLRYRSGLVHLQTC